MKAWIIVLAAAMFISSSILADVYVHGYYRHDGTYVYML